MTPVPTPTHHLAVIFDTLCAGSGTPFAGEHFTSVRPAALGATNGGSGTVGPRLGRQKGMFGIFAVLGGQKT